MKGYCPKCKTMIIEDIEEYREKYLDEKEVQCPHCGYVMGIR